MLINILQTLVCLLLKLVEIRPLLACTVLLCKEEKYFPREETKQEKVPTLGVPVGQISPSCRLVRVSWQHEALGKQRAGVERSCTLLGYSFRGTTIRGGSLFYFIF